MERHPTHIFALTLSVTILAVSACREDGPTLPEAVGPQRSMHEAERTDTQDTWLSQTDQNANFGADVELNLRESAKNRILIQFENDAITGADNFLEATSGRIFLRLTIIDNPGDWGPSGGTIDVHRMTQSWLGGAATYNCAEDTDLSNNQSDCAQSDEWDVKKNGDNPWEDMSTASAIITTGQTGTIEFDVTTDVQFFADNQIMNFGWVVKRKSEEDAGAATFGSLESSSGPELGRDLCPAGVTCGSAETTVSGGTNDQDVPVAAGASGVACDPLLGTNCVAQLFIEAGEISSITRKDNGSTTPPGTLLFGLLQQDGECLGLAAGLEIGPCVEAVAIDLDGNQYVVEFNTPQLLASCIAPAAVETRASDLVRHVRRQGFDPDNPGPALPSEAPLEVLAEAEGDALALDCSSLVTGSADTNRLLHFAATIWDRIRGHVRPRPLHAAVAAVTMVGDTKNTTSSPKGLSHFSWAKIQFPYRDAGYTFVTVGKKTGKSPCVECDLGKIPKDWFEEAFDDSEWNPDGAAPFSSVGSGSCDLYDPVATDWPAADPNFNPPQETHVLLRKRFDIGQETGDHTDEDVSLEIRIAGRNGFRVWLNEEEVTSFVTQPDVKVKKNGFVEIIGDADNPCPEYDEIIFTIPESLFTIGGENLLAVMGRSSEDEPSFVDVQVNVIEGN